jgi:hypothetical protein
MKYHKKYPSEKGSEIKKDTDSGNEYDSGEEVVETQDYS